MSSSVPPAAGSTAAAAAAVVAAEVAEFADGALFTWIESCLPVHEPLAGYVALLDGQLLHKIWLQIDPEPQHHPQQLDGIEGALLPNARARNFDSIIKNLKCLFEEELDQTVLVLPDCAVLGHAPESRAGLDQMKLLLTLLLGAAVQCPNKQIFIGRIKELALGTQHAIVELIKQVTDNQTLVLTNDSLEHLSPERMYEHIIRIARERDKFQSNWIASLAIDANGVAVGVDGAKQLSGAAAAGVNATAAAAVAAMAAAVGGATGAFGAAGMPGAATATDSNHMAVELADLKSKLRRFRQELEEKSEAYMEVKEELEHSQAQFEKLRTESQKWYTESRRAAAYRDEVDVLQERAERANRLELEVQRYREKLSDSEFFKTRVEELREDNRMLLETKEMLEDQLQRSRKRSDHAMQLETDIMKCKQRLNDMALDRDADKARLQEVLEENTQLLLAAKQTAGGQPLAVELATSDEECDASGDNSLSEQLTNNAQTRALKLELENRRLQQQLDAVRETGFHEHTARLLDAEKDKKRLSLKVDQLQENCGRLGQQNAELEDVFKNALEENKKLQDVIDQRRAAGERQQLDRDVDRMKLIDTEKHVESLTKEKQRIQTLGESIQRRADDLERTLAASSAQLAQLQPRADRCEAVEQELVEVRSRQHSADKENAAQQRDLARLREQLEAKDQQLDRHSADIAQQQRDMQLLAKQLDAFEANAVRLAELEVANQELQTQAAVDGQTIATLQRDLVEGTLAADRVKLDLERLGFDAGTQLDAVELNVESVVQTLVKNPETFKTVKEIMLSVARDAAAEAAALTGVGPSSTTHHITSSDICLLCHRHETFSVERNIEIGASAEAQPTEAAAARELAGPAASQPASAAAAAAPDTSKRVEFTVALEPPAIALLRDQLAQLQHEQSSLRTAHDALQSENARHRVDASTLGSQIQSLNTQHVALQLANTQLAADKDALVRQVDAVRAERQTLLHDQRTLQCLHEQLTAEYEALTGDRELLKSQLRDQRGDVRTLRERDTQLTGQADELQRQLAAQRKENENLGNLRAEHTKLRDDFRNLFATSERLKAEYKSIQSQYKVLRTENGQLRLQTGKLTDELNTRAELANGVELEYTKCAQRCELLLQMNANLDTDRRTLMDHVSQLLAQYHELLAHSLDDKQHYHDEEKLFTDKVNNLHRQKEKLEEKIMEHYKKLESCSPKKKPFGSSFVKRVKKASTDLINKVPSRNRRSWMLDDPRLTQSEITLGGSESGGNDSDNSLEETATTSAPLGAYSPLSVSAASHDNSSGSGGGVLAASAGAAPPPPLPPMLQRNAHHRQSLQRRPHGEPSPAALMRTGVRSSYQSLRREDSIRSHRNSIHSMEPPDVTGSSLTLGTAGSRRTVYLLDENASKLAADANNKAAATAKNTIAAGAVADNTTSSASQTTSTSPEAAAAASASANNINNNNAGGGGDVAPAPAPSTFLMFNRISNIIGGSVDGGGSSSGHPVSPDGAHNGGGGGTSSSERGGRDKPKPTVAEDAKESAIWYEYGCI